MDAKKWPKRPEQIWTPGAPDQAPEVMRQIATMMASNGEEFFKNRKTVH